MKIARERLMRRHVLWQSSTIMPPENFNADLFIERGVIGEDADNSIPYSDEYIDALINSGKLR